MQKQLLGPGMKVRIFGVFLNENGVEMSRYAFKMSTDKAFQMEQVGKF